ncbi:MAG: IPT/TIG domain-containing protein [Anaerolineae bacterium]
MWNRKVTSFQLSDTKMATRYIANRGIGRQRVLFAGLLLGLFFMTLVPTLAQDAAVTSIGITPNPVIAGQGGTVTVLGTNLDASIQVKIQSAGLTLAVNYLTASEMHAVIPNTLAAQSYQVDVGKDNGGAFQVLGSTTFQVAAPTNTPPPPPAITVTGTSPAQIVAGQSGILTVTGANFRPTTTVSLSGTALSVTLISANELRAAIPSNLAAGQYIIQVNDPSGGSGSGTLTVLAPTVPPPPTDIPPVPTIAPPPTEVPGAPSLLVRSFVANPPAIKPGGTTTFTFDIVNQGSRVAQSVSVKVDVGGKFIPANGQSAVLLPDIGVGASYTASLAVVAATDTTDGPQTVNITISYRDFSGSTYTSPGALTVRVDASPQASQITLSRYQFNPNPVVPGEATTVTILLTNSGNETASQVLASVGADGILLAGPQGNSFPIGDIPAGASASIDMPLVVSSSAKAGPQSQALTISFLQKGELKTVSASMTMNVAKVDAPAPVMIVDSFDAGFDVLEPGQEFTLTLSLRNIGNDTAKGLIVTFGGVDSTGGGIDPTPGASASTTTNPSNTFAPLGSVGTQNVGDVAAGDEAITLTQRFIVNGSVDSGIYSLPITLRYQRSDGSFSQDNLRASLPVIVPPQIKVSETSPMPEQVNVGDIVGLSLEIANRGRKAVNFTNAVVTAENADVVSGTETYLGPIRNDDQGTLDASFMPTAEGAITVTVTLNYTDDLNRPQQIVQTYELEGLPPLPPPDFGPPIDFGPQPVEEAPLSGRDLLGKVLLGLLGLGS